jgi:hypothetical protein
LSRVGNNKVKFFASLNYFLTQNPELTFGLGIFNVSRTAMVKLRDRHEIPGKLVKMEKWIGWLLECSSDNTQTESEYPALAKWQATVLLRIFKSRSNSN